MRTASGLGLALGAFTALQAEFERRAFRAAKALDDPLGSTGRLSADSRDVAITPEVTLRVAERGSGKTVLLVHGWSQSMDAWSYVVPLLPPDVHVLALDLRGHGGSSPVPVGGDVTMMAGDIARLMEVLDLNDVMLVGHSLGGIVTMALGVEDPEVLASRVSSVLLVSTKAEGASSDFRSRMLATLLSSRTFAKAGGSPVLGLMLARRAFAAPVSLSRLLMTREIARLSGPDGRVNFDLFKLVDISAALTLIKVPTTVLCGADDPATPMHDALHLVDSLPNATLRVVEETGHLLPLERPEAVVEAIVDLLALQETKVSSHG